MDAIELSIFASRIEAVCDEMGAALRRAHALTADYLPAMQDTDDLVDFCQISPELSRPPRGLGVWLPLKLHGAAAFRRASAASRRGRRVRASRASCGEANCALGASMPSFWAMRRTASGKVMFSIFWTNEKTSPLVPQPKQWKNWRPAWTLKEGVFSLWKGQRPL